MGKASLGSRALSPEALVALAVVASVIVLWPLRDALHALPGLRYAAALFLFVAPGLLLTRRFLREYFPGVAALPAAFVVSAGLFGMMGVPVLMAHRGLGLYLAISGGVVAASLLAAVAGALARGRPVETSFGPEESAHRWLWLPFAACGAVLAFASRTRVPHSYNDLWVYMAYVREF